MIFTKKKNNLSVLDTKEVAIKELELILTQKCNLACEHCMRGNATDKEISSKVFDSIFSKVKYVDNLALGGGEPSLVPHKVRELTASLKKHNVIVKHVNFTTNGLSVSNQFLEALLELKEYIESQSDKDCLFEPINKDDSLEPIYACFSFDDYHMLQIINNIGDGSFESLNIIYQNVAKYYNALGENAIVCRTSSDVDVYDVGRAQNLNDDEQHKVLLPEAKNVLFPYMIGNKYAVIGGVVTVSCDGEIIPPNISYNDEKLLSFGNITKQPLSLIFSNAKTKRIYTGLGFDLNIYKTFKQYSSSKRKWNSYLRDYGKAKIDMFYANVEDITQSQKDL